MSLLSRSVAFIALTSVSLANWAFGIEPPSRKPHPPYKSSVLGRTDMERFQKALESADDGDWAEVNAQRNALSNEAARDFLLWRYVTSSSSTARFIDLKQAISRLDGWPNPINTRARAEDLMTVSNLSSGEVLEWFAAYPPVSGEGKILYGRTLIKAGKVEDGVAYIRDAWHNHSLTGSRSNEVLSAFDKYLTVDDHIARTEYLLWSRQRSAAYGLRRHLPSGYRALVDARIALEAGHRGVDTKIEAVPSTYQSHPGLLYARSYWRRKRGRWDDALPLLLDVKPDVVPDIGEERIWNEKHLHARRAIKERDFNTAYRLASTNGLSSGIEFAEAEWLAGWIALRHQNQPERALAHFTKLSDNVSTPISSARGYFWKGEALTTLNRPDDARQAYLQAAAYKYTYYGQLAAERVRDRTIVFQSLIPPTMAEREEFFTRPIIQVMKLLAESGDDRIFRQFSYHLDDELKTDWEHQLLYELSKSYHKPREALRSAKAGLYRGLVAPDAAYPLLEYTPTKPAPGVEDALVLALSRQESELNPKAVSHADARGLMQLLPSTARVQAKREGLPYRSSWLTDDPGYNLALGSAHLGDLLDRFDGSYIMTIAAYNAGASRPARWVTEYGDPRRNEIAPVDFVESIPFSETRNYVQRVLENVQVYRHRLTGEPEAIQLSEDLARGGQTYR